MELEAKLAALTALVAMAGGTTVIVHEVANKFDVDNLAVKRFAPAKGHLLKISRPDLQTPDVISGN